MAKDNKNGSTESAKRDPYSGYRAKRNRNKKLVSIGALVIAAMFLIWTVVGSLLSVWGF